MLGLRLYEGAGGRDLPDLLRHFRTAAIISRNLYKKTGNIWTPAFLNGILMTTMAVANTMVAFK